MADQPDTTAPSESPANVNRTSALPDDVREASASSLLAANVKHAELQGAVGPGFWQNSLMQFQLERAQQHAKLADAVVTKCVDTILDNPIQNARADRMVGGSTEGLDFAQMLKATTDAVGSGGLDLAALVELAKTIKSG